MSDMMGTICSPGCDLLNSLLFLNDLFHPLTSLSLSPLPLSHSQNSCRPYSQMITYKPLKNNAVKKKSLSLSHFTFTACYVFIRYF